jgi:hypothetical protein
MAAHAPEVINLNSSGASSGSLEPIKLTIDPLPSSNFGPGVELLMNEKRKEGKSPTKDISVNDLEQLEHELNDFATNAGTASPANMPEKPTVSFGQATKNIFTVKPNLDTSGNPVDSSGLPGTQPSNVGADTAKVGDQQKTWDGYSSFNNIPINPDSNASAAPKLSPEDMLRKKFSYLRKLEDLESKGVTLTRKYNMDSPLAEMQGEYENIIAEKETSNSMKFQGKMLMAMITGLEFLNNKFDPFDLKLDGWAEQVNENIEDYDDIFSQLHEKYKSKATMAPELKLLFQLGGGAIMLHMTNTMFKSSIPGMDDIMRQNPELMQKFTQAAVGSMGNSNPGFSGFMSNVMQDSAPPQDMPEHPQRSRRNDVAYNKSPYNVQKATPDEPRTRPDMKGPSDISDILGGLKSKTINLNESKQDEGSVISLSELKEMKDDLSAATGKSRRRKSDKNTVSLDL